MVVEKQKESLGGGPIRSTQRINPKLFPALAFIEDELSVVGPHSSLDDLKFREHALIDRISHLETEVNRLISLKKLFANTKDQQNLINNTNNGNSNNFTAGSSVDESNLTLENKENSLLMTSISDPLPNSYLINKYMDQSISDNDSRSIISNDSSISTYKSKNAVNSADNIDDNNSLCSENNGIVKKKNIKGLEEEEEEELNLSAFDAPEWCVPIKANVLTFDWDKLAESCKFDVILMDPPWQLASQQPTRGVTIAYQQLPDASIEALPIAKLQDNGFIFLWVINNKYVKAFELLEAWGYEYVDDITWVKQTVNRRMAKGHGYYLQHAKETCLVGRKGKDPIGCQHNIGSDVIYSQRRGQSQKPEELYQLIEQLVPNGKYLEIFGRKNNLRDFWVTIGNEL